MIAVGTGVLPATGCCATPAALDAAFRAAFGQSAPLHRSLQQQREIGPKVVGIDTVALDVTPARIVSLGGDRYALVSYETVPRAPHPMGGAIALSYLRRRPTGWTLTRSWPELFWSGTFGEPANAGAEVHRFNGDTLFVARSAWFGMGERTEWISVVRLAPHRPVAYDDILGGATWPLPGSPLLTYTGDTCRKYDLRARILAPQHAGALFTVRYDGWTSPPGALTPRTPLHLVTSYVPVGATLVMRPVVPVPTCGR